jgi:hypothetical protein
MMYVVQASKRQKSKDAEGYLNINATIIRNKLTSQTKT